MEPAAPAVPLPSSVRRALAAHPLTAILALGAALRLAAAFASPGFAFHDDHFEVVEVAQGWLDGARDWLGQPGSWRSLVYPGLHWLVFGALRALGVDDPQRKMLVVRLLHAAWSTVGLAYGIRLADALGGPRAARRAGLLLACFWLAPFAAVRDLAEVVCQPPLLAGLWLAVRGGDRQRPADLVRAGLWLGLAFTLRFQTAIVPAALAAVLLAQRRVREAALLTAGAALSAGLLQGGSDWIGYGWPFSSALAYLRFNADPVNVAQFPRGPWHQYLGTLAGLLVPPTSLVLLAGFLLTARRAPRAFWPTFAFLALHSAYPGKQERFLLPVLPLLLVLGAIGAEAVGAWGPLRRRPPLWRGLWAWFWVVDLVLLAIFTTDYSKRALVEPLSYLERRGDARALLVDKSQGGPPFVPRFYLGRPTPVVLVQPGTTPEQLRDALAAGPAPNYAIIEGDERLPEREARLRSLLGPVQPLQAFEPSLVDRVLRRLNPRFNVNLTARVYATPSPRWPGTAR